MPLKNGRLSAQESIFVGELARTGDPTYAGKKAGYVNPVSIRQKLADPRINALIEAQRIEDLGALMPITTEKLRLSLESKSERTVLEAVKIVRSEWKELQAVDGGDTREDHELTPAELELRSLALRRIVEAFEMGQAIDITPDEFDVFG